MISIKHTLVQIFLAFLHSSIQFFVEYERGGEVKTNLLPDGFRCQKCVGRRGLPY